MTKQLNLIDYKIKGVSQKEIKALNAQLVKINEYLKNNNDKDSDMAFNYLNANLSYDAFCVRVYDILKTRNLL